MRFAFIAKHRSIWPVAWLCEALDVSRSGFHAWLTRSPSKRGQEDEAIGTKVSGELHRQRPHLWRSARLA
jgi:putative transposase